MKRIEMKIPLIEPKLNEFFKQRITRYRFCNVFTILFLLISFQAISVPIIQDDLLVRPESDGSLNLNAEVGKAIGPKIEYMSEWKAFGWFTSKDKVVWTVLVEKSGKYDVYMEWSVSDKEAGKPFIFRAENSDLKSKVGKTGSWETFKTEKIGTIQLSAGQQSMVFKPDSEFTEGALLDLREVRLIPIKTKATDQ